MDRRFTAAPGRGCRGIAQQKRHCCGGGTCARDERTARNRWGFCHCVKLSSMTANANRNDVAGKFDHGLERLAGDRMFPPGCNQPGASVHAILPISSRQRQSMSVSRRRCAQTELHHGSCQCGLRNCHSRRTERHVLGKVAIAKFLFVAFVIGGDHPGGAVARSGQGVCTALNVSR